MGVRYEFANIEAHLASVLAAIQLDKFPEKDSKRVLDAIALECERAKKAFIQVFLSEREEGRTRRYLHFHQQALVGLIVKTDPSEASVATELFDAVRKLLVDVLDLFKRELHAFFDYSLTIPHCLVETTVSDLTKSANVLRAKFTATTLDPALIELVFDCFKTLQPISYAHVAYLRHLQYRLSLFDLSVNDPDVLRQDLCKVLINLNYNASAFFDYFTASVKKALVNCETLTDRIDLISWFLKGCTQEQCLLKISFDPELPPIHVQVGDWLTQELEYLRQKYRLRLSPVLHEDDTLKDFKLNFELSVSQLAYLFKALIETGLIRNKNTSQLIRFLVKFVKTKKAESVSYESFRMKFYNPESGTKDAVKKMLASLVQYISKN